MSGAGHFFKAGVGQAESQPDHDADNSPRQVMVEVALTLAVIAAFVAAVCLALALVGGPKPV